MSRRFRLLAALLALPIALASCKINTINSFPTTYAKIRFVNVLAQTAAVDVVQSGNMAWPNVVFQGSGGSQDFLPSDTEFTVNVAGTATKLTSAGYALFGDQPYTLIAYGYGDASGC